MVIANHRVAIFGGDGRCPEKYVQAPEIVVFKSRRDGGNGPAKRLEKALRAGRFGTLVILTRWNGHSMTRKLRKLCAKLGVRVRCV